MAISMVKGGTIRRGGCSSERCVAAIRAGRPFHATPAGFGVTLTDYHFSSEIDAARALEQAELAAVKAGGKTGKRPVKGPPAIDTQAIRCLRDIVDGHHDVAGPSLPPSRELYALMQMGYAVRVGTDRAQATPSGRAFLAGVDLGVSMAKRGV